jgi:predicted metal-dependent phosphoesterase TrpH
VVTSVRIDLHSHSLLSDGTDPPAALVGRAARLGLDVVALSDHDHARGWPEAAAEAARLGLGFVPAIELSVKHRGKGVHLLAYLADPDHPGLAHQMRETVRGRDERLDAWVLRGEEAGIPLDPERIRARAGGSFAVSKNHVADVLVEDGVRRTRQEVFDELLGDGGPLFVRRHACPLEEAIGLVRAAGGVAVLAHPWGRGRRSVLPEDELHRLAALGLDGLEVDHREHDAAARVALRAVAEAAGLVVTGSSDYHGTNKRDHELGCHTTAPDQLDRIVALAAGRREESGYGVEPAR